MPPSPERLYQQLLVIRSQSGDRVAIEELIGRFQPKLRAFLYRMLGGGGGGAGGVDDLAQEIWMDVLADLPRLAEPAAFGPWFYRIARNRVFRLLRGTQHRRAVSSIDEMDEVPADEPSADEGSFSVEDAQAVHAALGQLDVEHREVLLLRFMEEMSYEDIALTVGCPIGTIRSRVHYAKRKLQRILLEVRKP